MIVGVCQSAGINHYAGNQRYKKLIILYAAVERCGNPQNATYIHPHVFDNRYIAPDQVPVQFGGMYKEDDAEFSASDAVTELTVKPSSKETVEVPATEGSTVVWELRVLGWEVSYGAEFAPDAEGGYTVIV